MKRKGYADTTVDYSTPEGMAKTGLAVTKNLVDAGTLNAVTANELALMKEGQSRMITLELTNNNASAIPIPFGTPLGDAVEQAFYPNVQANLRIGGGPAWYAALADLVDNQGVNATFLQAINKRFLRHAVYVSQIEVITQDNALGQQQRAEGIKRIVIPYNSVDDSCIKTGKFVPQFTEYTATTMLDKSGAVLGDFHGLLYTLLAGSTVKLNMYIQAIDTPTFKTVY